MSHGVTHLGLLDDEAIVLDTAALEIALLDHPQVDAEPYADLLALIAERVLRMGVTVAHSARRAEVLAEVIAHEFAFQGDRVNYDSPDNADLIRVIDRRRGLPVALAILYVAAARRVGWEAEVLNTPGHVLARIGGEMDPVLIDPFNQGRAIGGAVLAELLGGILGRPVTPSAEHLAPMSNRAVLVRLLMNQATRAEGEGRRDRALALYERMTLIAPDRAQCWWERARLEIGQGHRADARASLSAILELTRDAGMRAQVSAALDAIATLE